MAKKKHTAVIPVEPTKEGAAGKRRSGKQDRTRKAKARLKAAGGPHDGDADDASASAPYGDDKQERTLLTRKQCQDILIDSGEVIRNALLDLDKARSLVARAGMSVDSCIIATAAEPPTVGAATAAASTSKADLAESTQAAPVAPTTGGHCNTDHIVVLTGDKRTDRIAELKRNLLRRHRNMQPESKGDDKWDKPRVVGERRRRIVREKDSPEAPPEPPMSGYILFVSQMTLKMRHDRPNEHHDQSKVMMEISKMWRLGMDDTDRAYYNEFSDNLKREYAVHNIEFRATGSYKPSEQFRRLPGTNAWVKINVAAKNGLEREIERYETYAFPKRPPQLDKEYEARAKASITRRRLKLKGLLNADGTVKDNVDVEKALSTRRKRARRSDSGRKR